MIHLSASPRTCQSGTSALTRSGFLLTVLLAGCSTVPTETLGGTSGSAAATAGTPSGQADAPPNGSASTNGGSGGATQTAPAAGGSEDGGACETVILTADRSPPDMLIVLDRSTSMIRNDSGTDRLTGSVNAVNTVVTELENSVRFGLMTFPGDDGTDTAAQDGLFGGGRGGAQQCAAGTLDVPISIMNATPIAARLNGLPTRQGTPTAATLVEARNVMAQRRATAGAVDDEGLVFATGYVMLVTDGDPNCSDDGVGGGGGGGNATAQQESIAAVTALAGDGVLTYVIGFQTGGSTFAPVLDEMAVQGATGDTAHRSVNSGDELLEEFRSIAGSAVSCTFVLAQDVTASRVEILIDGKAAVYGEDWSLHPDGRTIELMTSTCDALQAGAVIEAEVHCSDVRVI